MKKHIKIGSHEISSVKPAFIIAEAGVNHNGGVEAAKKLVREAKRAGADCVKFQTFKAEQVVTRTAPKANYQLKVTDKRESQFAMLKKLELDFKSYRELLALCRKENITFLSTPYHKEDADFLEDLGVSAFKLASIHAVEHPFLEYVAKKRKPIILSTGMCTFEEVSEAVKVIGDAGNDQLILLQCTSNYPSKLEEANLKALVTLRESFDILVGYSDHTRGLTASLAAVALGAVVIEKHFTLDKKMAGPDHSSSCDPKEFAQLVGQIRDVETCLGSAIKKPTPSEKINALGMRRSLVAKEKIKAGTTLTVEHLTLKRPANGFLGNQLSDVLGKKVCADIAPDQIITLDLIR